MGIAYWDLPKITDLLIDKDNGGHKAIYRNIYDDFLRIEGDD
jgi:hypothetical protein